MVRKLKTYVTDVGFYQLAVAVPSMKAALAAWEMTHNPFQQGLARQTNDAAVIAAAEALPGRVLRRPIGTRGAFKEKPDLPKVKTTPKLKAARAKQKLDQAALKKATAALDRAREAHHKTVRALDAERDDLDDRTTKEADRWEKQRSQLEQAVKRAKG